MGQQLARPHARYMMMMMMMMMVINILITETNNERYVNWPHTKATHVQTGLSKTVYSHMGGKKLT